MSIGTVSAGAVAGMVFSLAVSIGLPLVLVLLLFNRTKAKISTFLIGAGTFIVFALVLERLLHVLVFSLTGSVLTDNIWLYGLYGGLAAALFEETGRWAAMHFFMARRLDLPNALMYGVGHGGTEAILIVGMTSISNLMTSVMVNTGSLQNALGTLDDVTAAATLEQLSALWTTPAYQFFLGGLERISAVFLQIALSVLVFLAVKNKKKVLWFLAFAMHFVVDFVTVVCADYLPIVMVEAIVAVLAALAVWIAVRLVRAAGVKLSKLSEQNAEIIQ